MLPKKKHEYYKKLVLAKLQSSGIEDKATMRISKITKIKNSQHGQLKDKDGNPAADQGPEYFEVRSQQATNMQRSLMKRILALPEAAIKKFLESEIKEVEENPEG